MARTAKQKAATRRMIAARKASSGTTGAKKRTPKKGRSKKGAKGRSIEARVKGLEVEMRGVKTTLHHHTKALVSGGLLTARAAKALPKIGR